MPRELTSHKVNGMNEALKIEVMDKPGSGGACHSYDITGFDATINPSNVHGEMTRTAIVFQNGPILESGINGISNEALLAIVEDRLIGFQSGKYACEENAVALGLVQSAQGALKSRTQKRLDRGVEGTHQV
jgi:hypothetical protein